MIAAITSTTWLLTGLGIGVVFVILVLLVFILQGFSVLFAEKKTAKKVQVAPVAQTATPVSQASDQDKAAVATALYLYFNDAHDNESNVLTLKPTQSPWHAVLNPRL